jgi:hypothetical protein
MATDESKDGKVKVEANDGKDGKVNVEANDGKDGNVKVKANNWKVKAEANGGKVTAEATRGRVKDEATPIRKAKGGKAKGGTVKAEAKGQAVKAAAPLVKICTKKVGKFKPNESWKRWKNTPVRTYAQMSTKERAAEERLRGKIDQEFQRMLGPDADSSVFEGAEEPTGWELAQQIIGRPGCSVVIDHNVIGHDDGSDEEGEYAEDGYHQRYADERTLRMDDFVFVGTEGEPITAKDVLEAFASCQGSFHQERAYFFEGLTCSEGAEPSDGLQEAHNYHYLDGIPEEKKLYVIAFNWSS